MLTSYLKEYLRFKYILYCGIFVVKTETAARTTEVKIEHFASARTLQNEFFSKKHTRIINTTQETSNQKIGFSNRRHNILLLANLRQDSSNKMR